RTGEVIVRANQRTDEMSDGKWADAVFTAGVKTIVQVAPRDGAAAPTESRVIVGYPIRDGGGVVVGAMGFLMSVQALQDGFSSIRLPENSVVSINDAEGRVLARSLDPQQYLGKVAYSQEEGEAANTEREGIDGVRRVYAVAPIAGTP